MGEGQTTFTKDEVLRMVEDARTQMRLDFMQKEFREHMAEEEHAFAQVNAKLDLLMADKQVRSKEITEIHVKLREEMQEEFVSKTEFRALKTSVVWAVGVIVAVGSLIQWVLTVWTLASKLGGGG